jgi:hypothetical protein
MLYLSTCTILAVKGLHHATNGQDTLHLLIILDQLKVPRDRGFLASLNAAQHYWDCPENAVRSIYCRVLSRCLYMLGFQIFRATLQAALCTNLILKSKE